MKFFKTMMNEFRGYKKYLFFAVLFVFTETTCDLIVPLYMGNVLTMASDSKILDENIRRTWIICIQCCVFVIIGFISSVSSGIFSAKASCGLSYNLRRDMFNNIQKFSFSNMDNIPLQSLITRITVDVTNIEKASQQAVRYIFRAPIMMCVASILAGTIHIHFGIMYFMSVIVMLGVCLIFLKPIIKLLRKQLKAYDKLNLTTEESLNNIKLVKSYVREEYQLDKFKKRTQNIMNITIKFERLVYLMIPILFTILYSVQIFSQGLSSHKVVLGKLDIGNISTLSIYAMQIFLSLTYFAGGLFIFVVSKASADRIIEVLDEKPSISNPTNPIFEIEDGSIEFKDVKFKYKKDSDKFSLNQANFRIEKGQTVGIIGATGSAKSTLVNLIPRLYDVNEGELLVGGKNVKEYDLKTLRDKVAVVLQENVLFSGTLRDNLKWGNSNATDEEIKEVLEIAQIKSFFEKKQENYLDMKIEKFGSNLSGGQKQRVSIARSLLKNPKILILDNSTNALDLLTDKRIREKLYEFRPDLTKIIITERISSIINADKIILMNNGVVSKIGNHNELLEQSEIYKEIFESQQLVEGGIKNV